jgi:DNA-binding XRE family transcriptional regulator
MPVPKEPVPRKRVGARLKAARRGAGLTQEEVASRLGVWRPTVSQMENGARSVKAEELEALASVYGVTRSYLLGEPVSRDEAVALLAAILTGLSNEDVELLMHALHVLQTERKEGRSKRSG